MNVVQTLQEVRGAIGYPETIGVDQGSDFISQDLDLYANAHGLTLEFSRPGELTDNAFIEAFNGAVPSQISERPPVLEACRPAGKDGDLAQALQRVSAAAWRIGNVVT
jgi:transposase InsO family protein